MKSGAYRDAIAVEAERILKSARHTHYQYDAVIDPETGTYDVDCSAFVGLVLQSVAPSHLALIPKDEGVPYPRAYEFFDYFEAPQSPGWERVEKLADADRGDIMCWRVSNIVPGHDTGHIFVVAAEPEYLTPVQAWVVRAFDASAIPHFDDSREYNGQYHSGVGAGTLRFQVDQSGKPAQFQFGPGDTYQKLPITIVRLTTFPDIEELPARETTTSPPPAGRGSSGHRIERAAVANEVLGAGEFALVTYSLPATAAVLLPATTMACWGPGQRVSASVGRGLAMYTLIGGVVLKNA